MWGGGKEQKFLFNENRGKGRARICKKIKLICTMWRVTDKKVQKKSIDTNSHRGKKKKKVSNSNKNKIEYSNFWCSMNPTRYPGDTKKIVI